MSATKNHYHEALCAIIDGESQEVIDGLAEKADNELIAEENRRKAWENTIEDKDLEKEFQSPYPYM